MNILEGKERNQHGSKTCILPHAKGEAWRQAELHEACTVQETVRLDWQQELAHWEQQVTWQKGTGYVNTHPS